MREPALHEEVIQKIRDFVIHELKMRVLGVEKSPLLGPAGNQEFFILIRDE